MSGPLRARQEAAAPPAISVGVWAAIGVAGGIISVALVCMVMLLVRATRAHRRLLADLEQRGIQLGQQDARQPDGAGVTKPRAVLRRNTFLPYSNNSGWGTLPSKESFGPSSMAKIPEMMTTSAPTPRQSSNRRGWSFHKRSHRSPAPKNIKLERIRTARLSAIIESPRPMLEISSRAVPEAKNATPRQSSPMLTLDLPSNSPIFEGSKPTSAPDLTTALKPAPLFSSPVPSASGTVIRSPRRRVRSNSVPSIYGVNELSQSVQTSGSAQKLPRNVSFIYRQSGLAPDDPVPPLPLRIPHGRSVSNVDYSPSRRSASSFESATSSILATASPAAHRSPHARLKQSPGHELHKSLVLKGPRPLRSLPSAHASDRTTEHFRGESIRSNVAQFGVGNSTSSPHSRRNSGDSGEGDRLKTAKAIGVGRPSDSGLSGEQPSTPKNHSRSKVTLEGSPTARRRSTVLQDATGNEGGPTRQLSRTSTHASSSRSSNGNPFQWDPTPMQSGKPTASRGSPDRKRAHRRQNCVRLSVTTGMVGPAVRAHSPSCMHGIQEEPSDAVHRKEHSDEINMIFLDTRPLPRPPSSGIFAPELRLQPTNIRASLTSSSPTLPLTKYVQENSDHSPGWRHSGVSGSSAFSIPTFPSPVHTNNSQLTFSIPPTDEQDGSPDAERGSGMMIAAEPLGRNRDELAYDPNRPLLQYPILDMTTPKARPNEGRPSTPPIHDRSKSRDSPPCSPKTMRPNSSLTNTPDAASEAQPPPDNRISDVPEIPARDPRRKNADRWSPARGSLTGPRAEPGRDLRKTVAALRRMNSDADDDTRTSRRYRQLGREATSSALTADADAGAAVSPRKRDRGSRARSKMFASPSKQFVPSSSYSLVSSAGLGIAGMGSMMDYSSNVGNGTGAGALGDDSYTSLTDLILPDDSGNIFGRRELNEVNRDSGSGIGIAFGGSGGGSRAGSSVWEDGEFFWETPSKKERRARSEAQEAEASPYSTPAAERAKDQLADGGGAGVGAVAGATVLGSGENDSDAENRAPTTGLDDDDGKGEGGGDADGKEEEEQGEGEGEGVREMTEKEDAKKKKKKKKRVSEREVLAPKVQVFVQPPSSELGTPQSLYDRDGFLK